MDPHIFLKLMGSVASKAKVPSFLGTCIGIFYLLLIQIHSDPTFYGSDYIKPVLSWSINFCIILILCYALAYTFQEIRMKLRE